MHRSFSSSRHLALPISLVFAPAFGAPVDALTAHFVPAANQCGGSWTLTSMPAVEAPTIAADALYYNAPYASLSGDVTMAAQNQILTADAVHYDEVSQVANAQGAASLQIATEQEHGIVLHADALAVKVDTKDVSARSSAFASTSQGVHGTAASLEKRGNVYDLTDVVFSTCAPDKRHWQIEAKQLVLDEDTRRARAYSAKFRVKDVPILALPYLDVPLDDARASGFLIPSAGFNSTDGLQVSVPYYLNLAPNYDATLTTHIHTQKNPMLQGQFRHLSRYGQGEVNASYLPNDATYQGKDRARVSITHTAQMQGETLGLDGVNLEAGGQYLYVTDGQFADALGALHEANRLHLPRNIYARATKTTTNHALAIQAKTEGYQSLPAKHADGTPILDKDRPYARLPEVTTHYHTPNLGGFGVSAAQGIAYFKKSIKDASEPEQSGGRIYHKVQADYPLYFGHNYAIPSLSATHILTRYDQKSLDDQNLKKENGTFSQTGGSFSITGGTMRTLGQASLYPKLFYTRAYNKTQARAPIFDSQDAPLTLESLYQNQAYLGHDRPSDLHAVTLGTDIIYRDLEGALAHRHLLDAHSHLPRDTTALSLSAHLAGNTHLDAKTILADGSFDVGTIFARQRVGKYDTALGFVTRNARSGQSQARLVSFGGSAPIAPWASLLAQGEYDLIHKRAGIMTFGLEVDDCCIGAGVYVRRAYDELDPTQKPDHAIMAQIRLSADPDKERLKRFILDKLWF